MEKSSCIFHNVNKINIDFSGMNGLPRIRKKNRILNRRTSLSLICSALSFLFEFSFVAQFGISRDFPISNFPT